MLLQGSSISCSLQKLISGYACGFNGSRKSQVYGEKGYVSIAADAGVVNFCICACVRGICVCMCERVR